MSRFVLIAIGATLILNACSRDPEARKQRFLESGTRYFARGKYQEASLEFRNATQVDPRFGQARLRLAETYALLGDHAGALNEYVRAADVLSEDVDVQVKAGEYLLAAGRSSEALARADAALKREPNRVDAHILRGNAVAGQRDFDEAISEIEAAIRLDPDRGASYTQLGFVESARGRSSEAEAAFRQALKVAPKEIKAHLALASFYWASGRMPEAEKSFRAAWQLDPKDPRTNRVMGVFSLAMGRTAEAEPYLRQLADSSPGFSAEFALTDYYLATGRTSEAINRLQRLVSESPGIPEPRERLARAHAAAGDRTKAHALVDEILRKNPQYVRAELLKGRLLADEGKLDEALARVQHATKTEPTSIEAQYALGGLYAARGDIGAAEKAFREVLRLNPRAVAAQVQLSRLQLASGNAAASLQTAEEAARNLPANLEVRLAVIRGLLVSKDNDRAEREIAKLFTEYPNLAEAHVQRGVLAAARNDASGARASFERALALDAESLEAFTGLVVLDLMARDFDAAKARVGERLKSRKPTAELQVLAARVYAASGQLETVEAYLRGAIEMKPTLLTAYEMLGELYLSQGKLDQARQEFDNLAERQSTPVAPLTMSGIILQTQGHMGEARKRFERALASDPRAGIAANNLAWLYVESGESLDMALRFSQTAVAAMPETPEVLDTLGWIYYKKNLPALAVPPLRQSVEKQPGNPVYEYHLGLAQLQGSDVVAGRQSLERALQLSASFAGADNARLVLAQLDARR